MILKYSKPILIALGALFLLVGIAAALLGPIEMYCFYLFSPDGPFHYEGFGFGSFMFGNIAVQIAGYYVLAFIFIPLGYGHLRLRRWARPLALGLLWAWLVVGAPLTVVAFFMAASVKDYALLAGIAVALALALSYLAVPWLLIRFYQSSSVRATFEAQAPHPSWIERLPTPLLVLCILYLVYAVVLHIPILFNGAFPLFGRFLFGLEGIALLDLSIVSLILLAWGTAKARPWAWRGALLYFATLTVSTLVTLVQTRYADLLTGMRFPPTEIDILDGIPVQGFHLAIMVGLPLLLTVIAILRASRTFRASPPT